MNCVAHSDNRIRHARQDVRQLPQGRVRRGGSWRECPGNCRLGYASHVSDAPLTADRLDGRPQKVSVRLLYGQRSLGRAWHYRNYLTALRFTRRIAVDDRFTSCI
jgi:hypothetical protein